MNRTPPPHPLRPAVDPAREALRFVAVTVLVGVIAATVFASIPTRLLPARSAGLISEAAATQAALHNPSAPTLIPPTPTPLLPRIGIVSGHRGNDSGAVCPDGLTEAEVNFDIASRVKVGLEARGFAVDLLDEFDVRLMRYTALALVSIHADSCAYINEEARGFKVAAARNSSVPQESDRLAACLIDRYAGETGRGFHAGSITPDMTFYHGFDELGPNTPAAIIETGFLNLDREFLTQHPEQAAQGIIDGIVCYVRKEPLPAP